MTRSFHSAGIELCDRIRELGCLYAVLELTTRDACPAATIYAEVAELLPAAFRREGAMARVLIEGEAYCSTGWCKPTDRLSAIVAANEHEFGAIEVGYAAGQGPDATEAEAFSDNERALLNGIAAHLGRMCYGRLMARTLNQSQRLESVSQLTGGLAHDFNNLLTVILGNAELLKELLNAQPQHSQIAGIIGAGGLWQALVDPLQLESALLNLVENARDAMPGGGRLTVETANVHLGRDYVSKRADLPAGQYVMVAVSDTGQGITTENLSRVFEPFYTTKTSSKGSGLGLSMVYVFVKQSRGHVELYSEPGEGTTVKLYLPRATESAPALAEAPPSTGLGGGESILLVEAAA